jgi:hypothetical protein
LSAGGGVLRRGEGESRKVRKLVGGFRRSWLGAGEAGMNAPEKAWSCLKKALVSATVKWGQECPRSLGKALQTRSAPANVACRTPDLELRTWPHLFTTQMFR